MEDDPPSRRQMMVLRFWDRLDLAEKTRQEISAWIDTWACDNRHRFHDDDEVRAWLQDGGLTMMERLAAWELFKLDNPRFNDKHWKAPVEGIALGAGYEYLKKVNAFEVIYGPKAIHDLTQGERPH